MSEKIQTNKAPEAIGPYSQAVVVGNLIFTSGQIPLNPETGVLEGNDITDQTHRVCKNLEAVLIAAGGSLQSAVKTVCFLTDMSISPHSMKYTRSILPKSPQEAV